MKNTKTMKKGVNKGKSNTLFICLFLFVPVVTWAFFFITTNATSIIMAFQHIDLKGHTTWAGFDNFKEFISNCTASGNIFKTSIVNSVKNYLICLLICLPLYLFFSYYIFKKTFASKFVQSVSMLPRIVPGIVISLVFIKFTQDSLSDLCLSIFNTRIPNLFKDPYAYGTSLFYTIWLSFSTSLIVYPNAMNGIDKEIFESAELDGVDNVFSEMWHIILPLIYPTLQTFLVTGFAGFLAESGPLVAFWYTTAPDGAQNYAYYNYIQTFFVGSNQTGYPVLSAGGLIMTIVIAPLTNLLKVVLDKVSPYEG